MDRRSFVQNVGSAVAWSAVSRAPSWANTSVAKIMAVAAHPGDGLFTMGATLAQQIQRGGAGALLSLSLGEKGAPKNIPVQQYGEMQRVATQRATHLIGADAFF
jgi:LmbE family N-acetylglucosaminyl deacetylase